MLKSVFNAAMAKFAHEEHVKSAAPVNTDPIVIYQTAGADIFEMDDYLTYADPDPVQTNNTENFIVEGIWHQPGTDMDHVNFSCILMGAPVYDQTFTCSADGPDCFTPFGDEEEDWTSTFGFDVPAIAPPFTYHVTVEGRRADDSAIWTLKSDFEIPT